MCGHLNKKNHVFVVSAQRKYKNIYFIYQLFLAPTGRYGLVAVTERIVAGQRFASQKTLPKRKHFIPKSVQSSCQISTYCTSRDK